MSSPLPDPEVLISHLSFRPNHFFKAMIAAPNPPKPPPLDLDTRDSSVGSLERLPLEMLSMILDMLDVQSLRCLSTVSYEGSTLVRAHPAYRDMVKIAPDALWALGRTGLLKAYSIAELHRTLQSQQCTECPEYGAFLFLPTCERCCWNCLRHRPSFRMLLAKLAAPYFDLTDRQLRSLPSLRVITGTYDTSGFPTTGGMRLFSVRSARALALKVHGSEEQLRDAVAARCKNRLISSIASFYLLDHEDQPPKDDELVIPQDDFFGMAFMPFPSLSKQGEVEKGLWCKGCELIFRKRHLRTLVPDAPESVMIPAGVLKALVPPGLSTGEALQRLQRRAHSRDDFLKHIRQCWGAWQLAPMLTPKKETSSKPVTTDSAK